LIVDPQRRYTLSQALSTNISDNYAPPSFYMWRTADNSGHTAAVLRTSTKIRQSRTSYARQTLGVIGGDGFKNEKLG